MQVYSGQEVVELGFHPFLCIITFMVSPSTEEVWAKMW